MPTWTLYEPIFKAHNPGCNCCPKRHGPDPDCPYYLVETSAFLYITQLSYTDAGGWSIGDSIAPAHHNPIDLFMGTYDQLAWSAEGIQELYGASQVNGSVWYDPTGGLFQGFKSSAPTPERCPACPTREPPLYPTWRSSQAADDFFCFFHWCWPKWISGNAAKLRCTSGTISRYVHEDDLATFLGALHEPPLSMQCCWRWDPNLTPPSMVRC